jgi:hypothetical protein
MNVSLTVMRHEKALEAVKLRLLREEIDRGYEQARRDELSSRSIDEVAQSVLKEHEI